MRRIAIALAAVGLALCALGVAVLPLQAPGFTQTLSERYSLADAAGLPRERMTAIAESVREYVVNRRGELPALVDGRPGFDAGAVSHLDDVADVLAGARRAVIAIAVVLAAAAVLAWRRGHQRDVAAALIAGGVATVALPLLASAAALIDFPAFFAAFHSLFFADGTWTFAYDSLLIRTFPEPFWVASGLAWALLVGVIAVAYGVVGAAIRRSCPPPSP